MIELEQLALKNFWNISDEVVPLKDQGLVMVRGENGDGKTGMFIEAPFYALFGKSIRTDKSVGAKLWTRGTRGGYVQLTLNDGKNRYTIIRARGMKKADGIPNGLSVLCNDKDMTRGTTADTQKMIEDQILCINPQTARHSMFYSAEIMSFPTMGDKQKKEILDNLLQFDQIELALKETRKIMMEYANSVNVVKEVISKCEHDVKNWRDMLNRMKAEVASWDEKHASELLHVTQGLREIQDVVQRKQDEYDQEQLKEGMFDQNIREAQDALIQVQEEHTEVEKHYAEASRQYYENFGSLQAELKALKANHAKLSSLDGLHNCSLCGSELDEAENAKQIEGLVAEIKTATERIEEAEKTEIPFTQDLTRLASLLSDRNTDLKKSEQEKSLWKTVVDNLWTAVEREKLGEREMSDKLAALQEATNDFIPLMDDAQEKFDAAVAELKTQETELSRLQEESADEYLLDEAFGLKGFRSDLLAQAIPQLNLNAEELRQVLETNLSVNFRMNAEGEAYAGTFNVDVHNPDGAASYEWDSRGERRRVDMMIIMSLLKLAQSRGVHSFGQAFLDEPFESLDNKGQQSMNRLFKYVTQGKSSVFMIAHTLEEFEGSVDQIWRVENGKLIR